MNQPSPTEAEFDAMFNNIINMAFQKADIEQHQIDEYGMAQIMPNDSE